MKRTSSYLYLGVWIASIAVAFLIGRWGSSTDASKPALATEANAAQKQAQAIRESPRLNSALTTATELDPELEAIEDSLTPSRTAIIASLRNAFALPMDDPQRSEKINELLQQYAAIDPMAALELANDIPSLRDAERARNAILETWANNEPMAALAWADTNLANVPTNLRNSQMRAIIRGFAATNPKAAFNYANGLSEETSSDLRLKNRLLGEVIETQIRGGGLSEAQNSIALMPDGPTKDSLQRELVNEWAAFDPASAAAYVQALGDSASTSLKTALISEWSRNDPAAAAAWLSNLSPDDPAYGRGTTEITREWTRYDLTASSEWLNSLPASPELDRAVATYTYRAAQEDPPTAMSWAESINNKNMRNKMMQQVAASWKSDDPEGFSNYLDESELNPKEREQLESAKSWHSRAGGWGGGWGGGQR